jgi:hypothetical protein
MEKRLFFRRRTISESPDKRHKNVPFKAGGAEPAAYFFPLDYGGFRPY